MSKKQIIFILFFVLDSSLFLQAQTVKQGGNGYSVKGITDMMNDSLPLPWKKLVSGIRGKKNDLKRMPFFQPVSDSYSSLRGEIGKSFNTLTDNPVSFRGLIINYTGISDSSYLSAGRQQYYLGNLDIVSSWSISGIPVTVSFRNQSLIGGNTEERNLFSVQYDRANYLDALRDKLKNKINTRQFLGNFKDPLQEVKNAMEEELRKDLDETKKKYKVALDAKLGQIGNLENLSTTDTRLLAGKMLGKNPAHIEEEQRLFTELQHKKNLGVDFDKTEYARLDSSLQATQAIKEALGKIEEHKKKWQSSGLLERMKQWDLLKNAAAVQQATSGTNVTKLAKQYLNLNGLQKFLLKVNRMNLGQNAETASPLTLQHFLNNGAMSEFLNNNKYLMLLGGKQQNYNGIADLPFTDNTGMMGEMAKALSLGKGDNTASHSHLSMMSFDQSLTNSNSPFSLNTFSRVLVTSFSQQMDVGTHGIITAELSKSATNYSVNTNVTDSATGNKSALNKLLSADDFIRNLAFSFSYEDEIENADLSYGIRGGKTANGYSNPGNVFLNSGSTEIGANLRKSFLKRQLQVMVRGDMRQYKYNDDGDDKWRNNFFLIDAKWKMKRGQYVSLRYQPNRMLRIDDGKKQTVSAFDRLSVDLNIAKKIKGIYYRNLLNLAYQRNNYLLGAGSVQSNSVLISSFQNIVLGSRVIYLNTNYNYAKNNSAFYYFNSSLLAEAGSSYTLFKIIGGSSAIFYNSAEGWYRQAGVRQSLSGQLNERFTLHLYADARKNIKVYQPLMYGLLRIDIGVQYRFNKLP